MDTRTTAIARLQADLAEGRSDEIGQFLLEYLAEWGPEHVDVQRLAELVVTRQDEE